MKQLLLFLTICFLFTSCVSRKTAGRYSSSSFDMPYKAGGLNTAGNSVDAKSTVKRIVIYNAYLEIIVTEPDTINRQLIEIAKKYNGYAQSIGSHYTVIRVVSDSLSNAVREISKLGKLERKSISGEDISEQYNDLTIKLENAEKARKRYLELLEKAQNVDETLKVEKELERLNTEIDLLKGKINKYDHLTQYSTISITLKEKIKPGIVGYVFIGVYRAVKWLFIRN